MKNQPYHGIRIIELSSTLSGRLAGLLFADQGAEVFVERASDFQPNDHDEYFDRNKTALPLGSLGDTASADIIIVDGDTEVKRLPEQIVLRITAALPGDEAYGELEADCSEDLLNALVGFFTDMATVGKFVGRPVIYTPLPLSSVYAGVNGAIAVASALVDRTRCGQGREVIASRIAGGLSAIGALALLTEGEPEHLKPADLTGLPEGVDPELAKVALQEAAKDPHKQLLLEQKIIPLNAPYLTSDNRFAMGIAGVNRHIARKFLKTLGLWDAALSEGFVDKDPYDPKNIEFKGRNLADGGSISFKMNSWLAENISKVMATKTAKEWEKELCEAGVPTVEILSFEEWMNDAEVRKARLVAHVKGLEKAQLGRVAWIKSAQPYTDLEACKKLESLPLREKQTSQTADKSVSKRPLEGFVLVDFANVIAGPNSGRMFSELGATVYKIDPMHPQHAPVIMVTWAAEHGVGKHSIILDMHTDEGKNIMNKLVAKADMVLANKRDNQFERMGLGREALDKLNPNIVAVQLTGHKGEKASARDNYPGYDPALQGITGLMERFGPKGCPTYHGVASCVDYLCGYLGTWAGVSALYSREVRKDGKGDWAESSLAAAASLTQLLLQQNEAPKSAVGADATGMTEGERWYKLSDGYIFALGEYDLSDELASYNVKDGLEYLKNKNIEAVPVQTCRQLADRHKETPTKTVRFEKHERDGWTSEKFEPTWFTFDGEALTSPGVTARIGSDAPEILKDLGYSADDIKRLEEEGVVGPVEWVHNT
ncbi:CAIB/BAIF family protein [hydrothermal vent metagenome]|uniref:CAIB/BAIF family protein n=1 Tax=hydrothermal vent metagenome TaxID=652676 RepID=A0A1W1EFW8_9ZZZZ